MAGNEYTAGEASGAGATALAGPGDSRARTVPDLAPFPAPVENALDVRSRVLLIFDFEDADATEAAWVPRDENPWGSEAGSGPEKSLGWGGKGSFPSDPSALSSGEEFKEVSVVTAASAWC